MGGSKLARWIGVLAYALAGSAAAGEIVDPSGRTVKVAEPVTRIAAAGPPAEVLLYAFAPDAMLGWVRGVPPRVAEFITPEARALPTLGGVTMLGDSPEVPQVLAAKPQLIFDYGDVDPRYTKLAASMQDSTGIPYILLDGGIDKTPEMIRTLGKATGRMQRAEELAAYAADILARAQKIAAAHASKPVRVYIVRSPDGNRSAMPGTHAGDVYDAAGLKNITEYREATAAQVAMWDPDLIVSLEAKFSDTAKTPAWANVRAVKEGKIITTPRLPWGWTDHPPSVQRLLGVLWLTSKVYGQPTAPGLRSETAKFFKTFFHVALTQEQLSAMLDAN